MWGPQRPAYPAGIYERIFSLGPIPTEPKAIEPNRPRMYQYELTTDDIKRLWDFVLRPERERGYR